jgi:hypothetical protein
MEVLKVEFNSMCPLQRPPKIKKALKINAVKALEK